MASGTFSELTSQSLDGIHPKQLSLLSDPALECLAALYEAVESAGFFPQQIWWMLMPLLEKPKGGYRAILLCAGPVRVWQRLRTPCLSAFEEFSRRDYWAFGNGQSAEDAVWQQSVRAEAGRSCGLQAAGFLWDGKKYYESFVLEDLRLRALAARVHPTIVKVQYNFWRGPRILRIGRHHSPRIVYARCGLPAGDIFNDVFVKSYAIASFDRFVARNLSIRLSSYVDDDTVNAVGSFEEVRKVLRAAADDLG